MKRRFTITLLILALVVVLPLLLCFSLRPTPSEAFLRYRDNPHLNVAYLPDYPIDDTLRLDITTITATDSTGWNTLIEDFRILPLPKEFLFIEMQKSVSFWLTPRNRYNMPMDSICANNEVIGLSRSEWAITIFHTKTENQVKAAQRKYYQNL